MSDSQVRTSKDAKPDGVFVDVAQPVSSRRARLGKSTRTPRVSKAKKHTGSKTSTISKKRLYARTKKSIQPTATASVLRTSDDTAHAQRVPIVRSNLALALLSPFRFPIDSVRLASNIARISGVIFVVLGAFFSFYNLQFINTETSGSSSTQVASINCSSTTETGSTADGCISQVQTTLSSYEADIEIDTDGSLSDVVPVNITFDISGARNVVVYAYEDSGTDISLGSAEMIDELHWKFEWDTTKYSDGEYRVKVLFTTSYGTKSTADPSWYTIDNVSDATNEESTTHNNTSEATSSVVATELSTSTSGSVPSTVFETEITDVAETTHDISLSIDENEPVSGDVKIVVRAQSAMKVQIYARAEHATVFSKLGTAILVGDSWYFTFLSTVVPNGTIELKAVAEYSDSTQTSTTENIHVENSSDIQRELIASTTAQVTSVPPEPIAEIYSSKDSPLSGDVDIFFSAVDARTIEVYTKPRYALTERFLGLAKQTTEKSWRYDFDTRQHPNGDYVLFGRVQSPYGIFSSQQMNVLIANVSNDTLAPIRQTYVEEMEDIASVLDVVKEERGEDISPYGPHITGEDINGSEPQLTQTEEQPSIVYIPTIEDFTSEVDLSDDERSMLALSLFDFKDKLAYELDNFAKAVREKNEGGMQESRQNIETMKRELVSTLPVSPERTELVEVIDRYLRTMVDAYTTVIEKNERVIAERVGDRIFDDTDRDGVSDYDEINLYDTNPFSGDSDGDGFVDGTEIMNGYDPTDATVEALVAFESPRENGIVRSDILTINTISTLERMPDELDSDGVYTSAIITGTALPNSFITLYIYSTPIIVTVKTDDDGSWSYIFDKELENGNHEVYVGMTDNAGRIVAKSSPLSFVKTAEAYTPQSAQYGDAQVLNDSEPSLVNQHLMLALSSIAVLGLGLVLLLLGLFARRLPKDNIPLLDYA